MLTCIWLKALEDLRKELKVADVPNVQVNVLSADFSPPAACPRCLLSTLW